MLKNPMVTQMRKIRICVTHAFLHSKASSSLHHMTRHLPMKYSRKWIMSWSKITDYTQSQSLNGKVNGKKVLAKARCLLRLLEDLRQG